MKLKRVQKSNDDWQKCCRWCHYYHNEKCYLKQMIPDGDNNVYKVAEEGYLSETIEETLDGAKLEAFRELEYKLRDWNISEKRIKEFNDLFKQCYDQFIQDIKPELDEQIDRCYQNHSYDDLDSGVYISDPEEYCCKEWC